MYGGQYKPFREEENEPSGNFGSGNQFFSRAEGGGMAGGDGAGLGALNNLEIEQKMGLNQFQQQVDNHLLPQEQRDKLRYGGNYLNIKEEK